MGTESLNGLWKFAYTEKEREEIPENWEFCMEMPVPGYWDDSLEGMKQTPMWSRGVRFNPEYRRIEYPLGTGKPADASLPYLVGHGWYKKEIETDSMKEDTRIFLEVGEAVTELRVFVNGSLFGTHKNLMTASEFELTDALYPGKKMELVLEISNQQRDMISTTYRGYKGFTGGIYGNTFLHTTGVCAIKALHVYPNSQMKYLHFHMELSNKENTSLELHWRLCERDGDIVKEGMEHAKNGINEFFCSTDGLKQWSEEEPYLYWLEIDVLEGGVLSDQKKQVIGIRRAERQGKVLFLNKEPVYLRGLTEHAYFPLTCTPPLDKGYYRRIVKKYKEIGFNWIRFHTTVPNELYLEACDELGMLVQVEAPNGFEDSMWDEIIVKCRKHPSVILYCGGNEERLTDAMISRLEKVAALLRRLAPGTLFSPMQALPYVDWLLEEKNVSIETMPIPHNPAKLRWLKNFSDVFQPQKDIGFNRLDADWREIDEKLNFYERPYTSHEVGINDGYIDLDLEKRYEGTRIGTALYAGARENLRAAGVLQKARIYYENSCFWSMVIRKIYIERLRLCCNVNGYDYLGAIDCHWHRTGYTPGILNEFHEYKPGESREEILRYNGKNVILLDIPVQRDLYAGEEVSYLVYVSVYEHEELGSAQWSCYLTDDNGKCLWRCEEAVEQIQIGKCTMVGSVRLIIPGGKSPRKCCFELSYVSNSVRMENRYNVWIYPKEEPKQGEVLICKDVDKTVFEKLYNGENVLFLNSFGMNTAPLSYTKMLAGRTLGNSASVIYDHPSLNDFPHEGWGDLQFYPLFEDASSILFDDDMPIDFEPIIEIVSSYKMIFKQSALFEFRYGKGKAMVCTLNLSGERPAQKRLLYSLLRYMNSNSFQPIQMIRNKNEIQKLFYRKQKLLLDYSQETGFDGNAVKLRKGKEV